jgi:hypothetical protein
VALGSGTHTIAYSDDFGVTFTGLGSTIFSTSGNVLLCYKNTWIAGGSGTNTLAYSKNSKDWMISSNNSIFSEVHGFVLSRKNNQDIIIAVGAGDNKIAFSCDYGKSWQLFSGITFFDTVCYDIATNDSTQLLIAGGVNTTGDNVAVSNNGGLTWTFVTTALTVSVNAVLWDGTKWWIGGQGSTSSLSYSFDGTNWISNSMTLLTVINDIDVNTIIVAVGSGTSHSIITSTTSGLSWVGRGKTIFDIGKAVQWNGKFWTALGSSVSNSIAYSSTGIVWTPCINSLTVFSTSGNDVLSNYNNNLSLTMNEFPVVMLGTGSNGIAYNDNSDISFIGLGTSIFTSGNRGIYNGALYVAMGVGASTIAISYTGSEWIGLGTTVFTTSGRDVCYFKNRFVATGEGDNTFATSYDGLYWVGSGVTMFLYGTAICNNDSVLVACGIGDYDNMAYSNDALNWTGLGYSIFDSTANGVATDGINFVSVGRGSVNTLAYSNDAITWNGLGMTVFDIYGTNVTWNGELFMAVGSGSACKVASSFTGQVWTLLTVSLSFANDIA